MDRIFGGFLFAVGFVLGYVVIMWLLAELNVRVPLP